MLRRVLSVLRRQPALGRSALAGAAALGLALACLNPQNDDLPSNDDRAEIANPNGVGDGNSANAPPANNGPGTPGAAPAPQEPDGEQALPPPSPEPMIDPGNIEGDVDGGDADEADAGASPDAGAP
jgi:hypothetical protein